MLYTTNMYIIDNIHLLKNYKIFVFGFFLEIPNKNSLKYQNFIQNLI